MEENITPAQKNDKNTKWFFFVLGILIGLVFGFSFYFIDKYVFDEKIKFSSTIEKIYKPLQPKNEDVKVVKSICRDSSEIRENNKGNFEDEELVEAHEPLNDALIDTNFFESEFSLSKQEESTNLDDIEMVSDVLLTQKNIPVQYLTETNDSIKLVKGEYFKVELWSSAIKNRYTYYLKDKVLKIKGMDISLLRIFFYDEEYYLQYNETFYKLTPNTKFEKLIEESLVVD